MKKYLLIQLLVLLSITLFPQSQNIDIQELEKQLEEIYDRDQGVRKDLSSVFAEYHGKPEFPQRRDSMLHVMAEKDRMNQRFVAYLLDSISWPPGLSEKANETIFLVIQHGGGEYLTKYADKVYEAYKEKKFDSVYYAFFVDRFQMYKGEPQVYGSQNVNLFDKSYVWPVQDIATLDARRAEVGLPPMDETVEEAELIWDKDLTIEGLKKKTGVQSFSW